MFGNIKYFALILILFLFETSIPFVFPVVGVWTPSLSLLLALFVSISKGGGIALQLGFFLGLCHETLSVNLFGTNLLIYAIVMWIGGRLKEWVFLESLIAQFTAPFVAIFLIRILMYLAFRVDIAWDLDIGPWWSMTFEPPLHTTVLMGPLAYYLFKRWKWIQ